MTHDNTPSSPSRPPFLSVVVPTIQGHFLKDSVGCLLQQSFSDIEIIVSDNDASVADAVLSAFPADNIRQIKTGRRLSIYENWEFGVEHATGQWVTLLADDDALLPGAVERIRQVSRKHPDADIIAWNWGCYLDGSVPGRVGPVNATVPPASGRTFPFDCKESIAMLLGNLGPEQFGTYKKQRFPSIMRSAYRRNVLDGIKKHFGRYFLPGTPDYTCAMAALACAKTSVYLDMPLCMLRMHWDSNGAASQGNTTRLNAVYDDMPDKVFDMVPIQSHLFNRNIIFDSLLRVIHAKPDLFPDLEMNWAMYFKHLYFNMVSIMNNGGDATPEFKQAAADFHDALAKQPLPIRQAVEQYMAAHSGKPRPALPLLSFAARQRANMRNYLVTKAFAKTPMLEATVRGILKKSGCDVDLEALGMHSMYDWVRFIDRYVCADGDAPLATP